MRSEISLPGEFAAPASVAPATWCVSAEPAQAWEKELYVNRSNLPVLTCPSDGGFFP
jgi:hypothetical protein